jgi:hypothetical protein
MMKSDRVFSKINHQTILAHPLLFAFLNFDFEFHKVFDKCVKPWSRSGLVPANELVTTMCP